MHCRHLCVVVFPVSKRIRNVTARDLVCSLTRHRRRTCNCHPSRRYIIGPDRAPGRCPHRKIIRSCECDCKLEMVTFITVDRTENGDARINVPNLNPKDSPTQTSRCKTRVIGSVSSSQLAKCQNRFLTRCLNGVCAVHPFEVTKAATRRRRKYKPQTGRIQTVTRFPCHKQTGHATNN